jgi:hypothetical protein
MFESKKINFINNNNRDISPIMELVPLAILVVVIAHLLHKVLALHVIKDTLYYKIFVVHQKHLFSLGDNVLLLVQYNIFQIMDIVKYVQIIVRIVHQEVKDLVHNV